jgi:peroxiredoxin
MHNPPPSGMQRCVVTHQQVCTNITLLHNKSWRAVYCTTEARRVLLNVTNYTLQNTAVVTCISTDPMQCQDTLKMTYGSSFLFADDIDKHRNKSQITAFLCFYLRPLTQRKALVRFTYVLPFVICNIFRKKTISDL